MGGRGASLDNINTISSDFTKKVMQANQGSPDELIKELSKLKFTNEKDEKAYGMLVTKNKSAVWKNKTDEIEVRFESNYTGKEINNSTGEELYSVIRVYQKKNNAPYSLTYVYQKRTKSLKNIKSNYDKGIELYNKITKSK